MQMSRRRLVDHELNGVVALSFEYPQSWRVESRVDWNFEHTAHPCQLSARVNGPMGEGWELLPTASFYWNNDFAPAEGTFSRGQWAFRPRPIVESLTQLVLPRHRHPCRVVKVASEPSLAQPCTQQVFYESARVRVEYADLEEDFLALLTVRTTPGQINWGFEQLYGFRARRGLLDGLLPLYEQMLASLCINSEWRQQRDQCIIALNQQVQQFHRMWGDLQRAEAQAARAQLDYLRSRRETCQRIYDDRFEADARRQAGRGDVLAGRERYHDPYYGVSEHGYHTYVWSDGQGNYQYSEDPLYNPNQHCSGSWVLLTKVAG